MNQLITQEKSCPRTSYNRSGTVKEPKVSQMVPNGPKSPSSPFRMLHVLKFPIRQATHAAATKAIAPTHAAHATQVAKAATIGCLDRLLDCKGAKGALQPGAWRFSDTLPYFLHLWQKKTANITNPNKAQG